MYKFMKFVKVFRLDVEIETGRPDRVAMTLHSYDTFKNYRICFNDARIQALEHGEDSIYDEIMNELRLDKDIWEENQ